MAGSKPGVSRQITALKVQQWLKEWNKVIFDEKSRRRRPDSHFYLFSLSASELKALSGIQRRTIEGGLPRSQDIGIQRRHDEQRSQEIGKFIRYGYPWSDLSDRKRSSGQFNDLRKPGWLPTSIVVNILKPGDKRRGQEVAAEDLIAVVDDPSEPTALIRLPDRFTGPDWKPKQRHPIEVIDGQHRLWAFEDAALEGEFELPVVAFHGLDISWQAYLFWTINIKPKRINASLAFDLYPLLRTADWLEKFEGHSIYRETRAQELTEALWDHPQSPWHQRINMLGEPGLRWKMVSQAAWIRSLMATFVRSWEGRRASIGGLFGAPIGADQEMLPWSRAEQAAFLILVWQQVADAVRNCRLAWAESLRMIEDEEGELGQDPAFAGPRTLLNTDQGVRGVLYVTNDLCYIRCEDLALMGWGSIEDAAASDETAVTRALDSLKEQSHIVKFLQWIAASLAKYDWRTASAPGLSEDEKTLKLAFRGSGGYKELRRQLLRHLSDESNTIGITAEAVLETLGYD
jgi:DGQHR domain-containing protein